MINSKIDKGKNHKKYKIEKKPFRLESAEEKQRRLILGDTKLRSNPLDNDSMMQNKTRRR